MIFSTPTDRNVKQRKSPGQSSSSSNGTTSSGSALHPRFERYSTPILRRPPVDGTLDLPTLNEQRTIVTFIDDDLRIQRRSPRTVRKRLRKTATLNRNQQGTPALVVCFVSMLLFPLALLITVSHTSLMAWQSTKSLRLDGVKIASLQQYHKSFHIIFSESHTAFEHGATTNLGHLPQPQQLAQKEYRMRFLPDYGTIDYHNVTDLTEFRRQISANDTQVATAERNALLESIDGNLRSQHETKEDREDKEERCRDPSWVSDKYFSCNQMHEAVVERPLENPEATDKLLQDYSVSYLSHGTYRDTWKFHRQDIPDDFVLKRFMLHKKYNQGDLHTIHKEAVIMERLMPSPRIMDIYGYCGTSVLVETMASEVAYSKIILGDGLASQADLDKLDGVYPKNNLTNSEKLQLSLYMAESLVDLHEFREGGLVVHSDTHIEQFLIAPDKTLKLGDYNNAHVMRWDDKRQEYCTRHSMYGGTWRSPEEYDGSAQDETKDTYSFGNGIYAMLTGLWPFYDDMFNGVDEDTTEDAIIAGKRPFVDERYKQRSFIEKMLVEVMEACWAQDRKDRPSMTWVVEILKKVKATAQKKGELEQSSWLDIPMPE